MNTKRQTVKILLLITTFVTGTLLLSFTHIGTMVQDKWIAPKSADTIKNPYEIEPLTVKQGEEIYLLYCAPCHGDYGYGDGAAGGASGVLPANFHDSVFQKQSDGAIFWKLSEGRNNMPPFKGALSEEQLWQLVVYIRDLPKNN